MSRAYRPAILAGKKRWRFLKAVRRASFRPRRGRLYTQRSGFTLFELMLAIGLSAALLALIGTAINLYLSRVDASRSRVEEAQLARTVLAMIASDIRAASIYQPQDTSAIAEIMAKTQLYNVDEVDKLNPKSSSTSSSGGTSSGTTSGTSSGGSGSTAAGASSGGSGSSAGSTSAGQSSSSGSSNGQPDDNTLPLGLTGSEEEVYVDATRLPNSEEVFRTTTGYTNVQSPDSNTPTTSSPGAATATSNTPPPADLFTIHYFVRPGDAAEPGNAAVTSLDPASQQHLGGLVRQELPRASRHFAEQNGSSDVLDSNQVLVAPEVVQIDFKYFDGSQVYTEWDMKEQQKLPVAVEVSIWLRSPGSANQPITTQTDAAGLASNARQYRQVVYLPMAAVTAASQSGSSGDSSMSDSTGSSSSDSSNSPQGTESSFNQSE